MRVVFTLRVPGFRQNKGEVVFTLRVPAFRQNKGKVVFNLRVSVFSTLRVVNFRQIKGG